MLVAYGADVNPQSTSGATPFHVAYESLYQYDIMYFLLSVGANPEIPDGVGYTVTYEVYEDLKTFDRKSRKRKNWMILLRFFKTKATNGLPLPLWSSVMLCGREGKRQGFLGANTVVPFFIILRGNYEKIAGCICGGSFFRYGLLRIWG